MLTPLHERREFRELFLARIERLLALKRAQPAMDVETQRLIAWALISAYRDCVQLGVGSVAEAELRDR